MGTSLEMCSHSQAFLRAPTLQISQMDERAPFHRWKSARRYARHASCTHGDRNSARFKHNTTKSVLSCSTDSDLSAFSMPVSGPLDAISAPYLMRRSETLMRPTTTPSLLPFAPSLDGFYEALPARILEYLSLCCNFTTLKANL